MTEGEEWKARHREKRYPWMNDDQWGCYELFLKFYKGAHHIHGKIHECGPNGILLNSTNNTLATYDFNNLTRLVFLAHDMCVRVEITSSGPRMIGIMLHKRKTRSMEKTHFYERHPTIETALSEWRKSNT